MIVYCSGLVSYKKHPGDRKAFAPSNGTFSGDDEVQLQLPETNIALQNGGFQ